MPTYDYQCASCGHCFEQFQSISTKPLKKCPLCGNDALKRLIGAGAGIIFKGSGFYQTDYRNKYSAKAESRKPETKTETKTEVKTESKPEMKSQSKPVDKNSKK